MTHSVSRRRFMQAMFAATLSAGAGSLLAGCTERSPAAALPTSPPTATLPPTAGPNPTPGLFNGVEETSVELPDGRTLEVRTFGPRDGQVLLFQHGTPAAGLPYLPMARAAAERGLRTVTYSRPGYGKSTAMKGRTVADAVPDVAAVLDTLSAKTFRTIGLSGGAPHALACAALLPDRCLSTAAIGCPAPVDADGIDFWAGMLPDNLNEYHDVVEKPERFALTAERSRVGLLSMTPDAIRPPKGYLADADWEILVGDVAAWLLKSQQIGLSEGIDGWRDDDLAMLGDWGFKVEDARQVSVWHGRDDNLVPPQQGMWIADHIAGARRHLLEGEGHISIPVGRFEEILDELTA